MSQPQPHSPSRDGPHPGNPAERLAQADRVIERERKQRRQGIAERRKMTMICRYRRRKGDR